MRWQVAAFALALLPSPGAAQIDVTSNAPAEWRAFRDAHPYHVQTIALGRVQPDGSRLLVITEPPPGVTRARIVDVDSSLLANAQTYRQRVGFDGWVKDVVVSLPALSAPALNELVARLHLRLFGTTYRASAPLLAAIPPAAYVAPGADVSIRADELQQWLFGSRPQLFAAERGKAGSALSELLEHGSTGVYYGNADVVAWIFPRTCDLTGQRVNVRRFAIDSDLLLGAVADARSVAIIARARRASLDVLPPLRAETILLLASVPTDHLAQSYERTFALAGRLTDERDWAPIYLSSMLLDSEYGSLLNLTDQLLKSWSEFGSVKYVNFLYPVPPSYPFPKPLHEFIQSNQVTFNWNTAGAGYTVADRGRTVYALNRTGALPVSYFAGDEGKQDARTLSAETRAYAHFASLTDPNLVRVVQYAALYQIFRAFRPVQAAEPLPATNPLDSLRDVERLVVRRIRTLDSTELQLTPSDSDFRHTYLRARARLDSLQSYGDTAGDLVIDQLLLPRDRQRMLRDDNERMRLFVAGLTGRPITRADSIKLLVWRTADAIRFLSPAFAGRQGRTLAASRYVRAARRPEQGWIQTASIVLSWPTPEYVNLEGGHNLDATVTRFRASNALARGEVHVVREGGETVILAHPADIARHTQRLRSIAGNVTPSEIEHLLKAGGGAPPPPPRTALAALGDWPERPPHGEWTNGSAIVDRSARVGFSEGATRALTAEERAAVAAAARAREPYFSLTRRADGSYEILIGDGNEVTNAYSMTAAIEAVARKSAISVDGELPRVHLYGFSEEDASIFMRNVEWTLNEEGLAESRLASGGANGGGGGRGGRGGPGEPAEPIDNGGGSRRGGERNRGEPPGGGGRRVEFTWRPKSDAEFIEQMHKEADLSKARVRRLGSVTDLQSRSGYVYEVTVPNKSPLRSSFRTRITTWFKSAARSTQFATDKIGELFGRSITAADPAAAMEAELRAAGGDVHEVRMEYLKMRIVLHTTPRDHGSVRADVAE